MSERKPVSKKLRFEVFKRDAFTCQYCGQMAPDVVLEVDHIKPVASGGKNEILNLITSCMNCNRGKGPRELDDNSTIRKQQRELVNNNERKEQLKMMLAWKEELSLLIEGQTDAISALFDEYLYSYLSNEERRQVKILIHRFGFPHVYDCAMIAVSSYKYTWQAVKKLGGICYNRANGVTRQ